MSDYSEQGAVPVEDAAVDDPPTVDEVLERQRREHPHQAASGMHPSLSEEEAAAVAAGGEVADPAGEGDHDIAGPNSA